jgi:sugar phosphate isomerase/epimerase
MVTGDLPLAANNSDATRALHRITPYLDLAEALGAKMVRVMLHGEHDIPLAQQAADEAALRGITLAQQCHWGSMAETVEQALSLASKVARDNFGITYEPANLLASGGPFGADAVTRLQSVMVNVYYQNICLDEQATLKFPTRVRGDVGVRFLPLADPAGIDTAPLVRALREIDYTGWFTVHQPLLAGETLGDVIKGAGALIRTL